MEVKDGDFEKERGGYRFFTCNKEGNMPYVHIGFSSASEEVIVVVEEEE